MTNQEKRPDPKQEGVQDIQQESTIEDKNPKDRPGTRPGQQDANGDYDYRPDFGTSGGGAEYDKDKMLNGKPTDEQPIKPKQEGDNPNDLNKPEEKMGNQTSKK